MCTQIELAVMDQKKNKCYIGKTPPKAPFMFNSLLVVAFFIVSFDSGGSTG